MDPCDKFQEETIGISPVRVKPRQIHVTLYFSGYPALCETAGRPTPTSNPHDISIVFVTFNQSIFY